MHLTSPHWPQRPQSQKFYNCVSKLLQDNHVGARLHVFGMRAVLSVHKSKTPRCSLSNTGPTFKTEIRRQIGEGGGECPPVSDSCLDWQRRTCQSGSVSVFSPCSTALTAPAAHPEVCRFHQLYPGTRAADINYQELSQMVSLKAFFPFILKKYPSIHTSIVFFTGPDSKLVRYWASLTVFCCDAQFNWAMLKIWF